MSIFRKYVEKIQVSLKLDKKTGSVHEDRRTFSSYLTEFFLEWKYFRQKLYRNQHKRLCSI